MNDGEIQYLIDKLESILSMMRTSEHMAAAKLLSVISLLKGQIKETGE